MRVAANRAVRRGGVDKRRENGIDEHRYNNFERVLVALESYQPRFVLHLYPPIFYLQEDIGCVSNFS